MAGALGRPVLGMLPRVHDWRWFARGDGDRWFPTLRLFRQSAAGEWRDVIEAIGNEITKQVNAS